MEVRMPWFGFEKISEKKTTSTGTQYQIVECFPGKKATCFDCRKNMPVGRKVFSKAKNSAGKTKLNFVLCPHCFAEAYG